MWWINTGVGEWRSRISFGLAFFMALAVGLWPDHARAVDPTKLAACITAGLAWIIAEIASIPTDVSSYDVRHPREVAGSLRLHPRPLSLSGKTLGPANRLSMLTAWLLPETPTTRERPRGGADAQQGRDGLLSSAE